MDPKLISEALDALIAGDVAKCTEILKSVVVSAATGGAAPDAAVAESAAPDPATPENADAPTMQAMSRTVCDAVGCQTLGESLERIKTLRKLESDSLAAIASAENVQRVELVGALVTLGVDTPATAWADSEKKIPCARLAAEPIADLRARVTALRAAKGTPARVEPPVAPVTTLSKVELAEIKKRGWTEDEYIARKASVVRRIA
jgi:hypothetical protein